MNPIDIPQLVDEPPHVLFWQSDEVAPIGIGLVFGMFTGYAAIATIGGFLLARWYRKYRDDHPDGFMAHMIYWYVGVAGTSSARSIPNPFIREYN
ncbi:TPA: type IV conjugative transfer system protein TraL [Pseudomonas aeruginosa]|nr:type IV conjugative transfer system protein TraL [Pseudomonas aeruginosa]EIU2862495.1 type IV conjugative transfer system protein TraL [Pseudomonas aeruginosa]